MIKKFKLFEQYKKSDIKDILNDSVLKHEYIIDSIDEINDQYGFDVKISFKGDGDGLNEYDYIIKELMEKIGKDLNEIYTEENGNHFKIYLKSTQSNNAKNNINEKNKQSVFTKLYMTDFLKAFKYELKYYKPNLLNMSINIIADGDINRYENMIDRLITLNYKDIKHIKTIKKGKEFEIYIKEF